MSFRITKNHVFVDEFNEETINNCKNLFRLARLARRKNKRLHWCQDSEIKEYNENKDDETGFGWTIYNITAGGTVEVGCKYITWEEMLPIAKKLGFRRFD